jgi:hypothetical protein
MCVSVVSTCVTCWSHKYLPLGCTKQQQGMLQLLMTLGLLLLPAQASHNTGCCCCSCCYLLVCGALL